MILYLNAAFLFCLSIENFNKTSAECVLDDQSECLRNQIYLLICTPNYRTIPNGVNVVFWMHRSRRWTRSMDPLVVGWTTTRLGETALALTLGIRVHVSHEPRWTAMHGEAARGGDAVAGKS